MVLYMSYDKIMQGFMPCNKKSVGKKTFGCLVRLGHLGDYFVKICLMLKIRTYAH